MAPKKKSKGENGIAVVTDNGVGMAGLDPSKAYQIIAHPAQESLAKRMVAADSKRFTYHPTSWGKFKDGTDNIEVGGFYPVNYIRGQHVLFLSSFHDNDATLSQFHVLNMLCESFVDSMTVILAYYPTGTMERVLREGQVATASTLARLFFESPARWQARASHGLRLAHAAEQVLPVGQRTRDAAHGYPSAHQLPQLARI
mmetsp:Transcript_48838/g.78703  ORF Transcript_48838/g.78703 Transcript_48838/m.78703 type:complete len:200 (-) Transcript_48838:1431-2030(-)